MNGIHGYLKEVEKDVGFDQLIDKIYSTDMNEAHREILVEQVFSTKEFIETHI